MVQQLYVLERLYDDHHHFSKVLLVLDKQLGLDGEQDWPLIADIIDYLKTYADSWHHPLEESMYQQLLAHNIDEDSRRRLENISLEHALIKNLTLELELLVAAVLEDQVIPMTTLSKRFSEFLGLYRQHILMENRTLFPLAKDCLSKLEWARLEKVHTAPADPLVTATVKRYQRLYTAILE